MVEKIGKKFDILSIITISLSIASFVFSLAAYFKALPLSRADLVFSEDNVIIDGFKNIEGNDSIGFTPKIQNLGKSSAFDVKFKSYVIYQDPQYSFENTKTDLLKTFDDNLVGELHPDSSATFGTTYVGRYYKLKSGENIDLVKNKEGLILIYYLEYKDSIPFINKTKKNCYVFGYTFGYSSFHALLNSDYQKIKDRLKNYKVQTGDSVCESID